MSISFVRIYSGLYRGKTLLSFLYAPIDYYRGIAALAA